MRNIHYRASWYLLPVAIILILIIGPMLRDGMFLDGLVYTNIARNLADGVGSFWQPLNFRNGPVFHEHPVLLPYVESLFFRIFGDGLHTEDLYNGTVFSLTIATLFAIWREVVARKDRLLFFFPLLLWVLGQEVQLRYPNTMLECGTTLILLASVFGYLRLTRQRPVIASVAIGCGVFLSVLCKGPFGLFLLAFPFLYQRVVNKSWSWVALVVPVATMISCFSLLFIIQPAALDFFTQYINQQVIAAIAGERTENIATTRFDFLYWLVLLNLPALILCALVALLPKAEASGYHRMGVLFPLAGGTAIVPLIISIKQAAYYQLTSLPFFLLGLSFLLVPQLRNLVKWVAARPVRQKILTGLGLVGLIAGLFVAIGMWGATDRRDQYNILIAKEIATVFKQSNTKDYKLVLHDDVPTNANRSYSLTQILNRYHDIHLDQLTAQELSVHLSSDHNFRPAGNILFSKDGITVTRP